ncbi:Serine/threonine protein kinase [Enhygromyxa salina]|uniref:Serine/threonine protein kinase n=1 Tax=Enhygromyxa salina TaxID=215803 RepID=A0A0C1ZXW2_9BACT|nr:protein kinase [Enhygromyxa salina]KIG16088.1 Serine/threonine protein kinase [Enhygromyxa salina]
MQPSFALTDSEGRPLEGWQLVEGPWDVGSEERWLLRLADGRLAVLGRLSAAFARDESVRRRWVRDVERLVACAATSVAPVLATGPLPDPRDPTAPPPWRLRLEPEGERVSTWLERAPIPIDELAHRGAALADALHAVHLGGAVVRNLHPRDLVWTPDGRVVLTDVGLARVDLLSSHTASSLLITGSAYAAPEQLMRTVVDQRADLYSLGVILWQAATGDLPFGEGPALLRERVELPLITGLRRDAPPVLDLLLRRCLAERPEQRPDSAAEIAWVLRGGAGDGLLQSDQTVCQHCGAALRLGQRLCLSCGRLGVRFVHQDDSAPTWGVELTTLREDAKLLASLREFVYAVARGPLRADEFVIGDVTLYSDQELVWRKRLPARLFDKLDEQTAHELCARLTELGLDVRVVPPNRSGRWTGIAIGAAAITTAVGTAMASLGVAAVVIGWTVAAGVITGVVAGSKASSAIAERRLRPLYQLRAQPAALPASDPLVARIAALLDGTSAGPTPADVRAQLGELALLVQRLVDRRAELTGLHEARELELLTGPVEPLITELEARVRELARHDRELSELDEATMVRALAAIDARTHDPGKRKLERQRLLDGLDRLRSLEDRRTTTFHGLLEASTLLRRAIDLGLGIHDPAAEQERRVQLALAALS